MLRFEETRITQLLKETIKVICRSADNCSEIAVQGLLGITLDRKEIFLVQIDDVIDKALERTGNPFHANGNSGSTDPNSTQGLSNQAAEQSQRKPNQNLTTGSVDGSTLNNSTIPENRITQQTWNNISVADSANRSLLQTKTPRGEKTNTEGSISFSCLSNVQGSEECSTDAVSTPVVMASLITATKTTFARASTRGRGRSRGQRGRGRGQCGRGRGHCGRARGQCGMDRGHSGRGRGKLSVTSSYRNKGSSLSVSDGLNGVPLADSHRRRTRSSYASGAHGTVISSSQETVDNDSKSLKNLEAGNEPQTVGNVLEAGNESQTVGNVQSAERKTLKTLKQPGFKRKLKPHGVITSKKSKHANCSADFGADTGVPITQPQVSTSDLSHNRCGICKRAFTTPTGLADHYIIDHYSKMFASRALKAVHDKTPVKCLNPTCGRTFPKQAGMLLHYGKIHGGLPSRCGQGRLTGARSGTVRKGLRVGTLGNSDTKLPEMNVLGQIIPSASYAFEPALHANTQRHSPPHTVSEAEFSDTERDNGSLLSSSMIIKEEIDSNVNMDGVK